MLRGKQMKILKMGLLLGVFPVAMSAVADEVVSVASMEVKERIQTMEQINVSSELVKKPETPTTDAVAALLEEASQIEAEDKE